MTQDVITALVQGGGGALVGAILTYLSTKRIEQRKLTKAEFDYLSSLQDKLTAMDQKLMDVAAEHMNKEIGLERDKYLLQEDVKDLKTLVQRHADEIHELEIECQTKSDRITFLEIKVDELKELEHKGKE